MRAEPTALLSRSRHLAYLSALPLVLAGCASNPMVEWQPKAEKDGKLDTMETARADANALKQAFHTKASTMVANKAALNDGLLGLGILTMGLATGGAHKDAYLATSGLAGTSYLFGNANLQPNVLAAYQSGISAVNCAVSAVGPMQVEQSDLTTLRHSSEDLRTKLVTLAKSISQVEVGLANLESSETELRTLAANELKASRELYQKGQMVNAQAAGLPAAVSRAAGLLKGSLAEIHRVTNELAARGVADSSSVMESLKSLVSVVSGFAPGLGLDTLLNKRVDAAKAQSLVTTRGGQREPIERKPKVEGTSRSVEQDQLTQSIQNMAAARAEAAVRLEPLASQLARYSNVDSRSELTACKIDPSLGALTVDRGEITFISSEDTDQSSRFVVRGGTKPYKGAFRDFPTRGIEVVNPIAFDSAFEVKVPKQTPAGVQLVFVVSDAASPPNERVVQITVAAAAASAPENASQSSSSSFEDLGLALKHIANGTVAVLNAEGTSETTLKIIRVRQDEKLYRVDVACTPKAPPKPISQAAAKTALLESLENSHGLKKSSKNESPPLIEVKAQPNCIK